MKNLEKFFTDPLIYNYCFLFLLVFSNVVFINNLVNPMIKLFALWGIVLILYGLWKKKFKLNSCFLVFCAFLISVLITNIINFQANFYLNSVMLIFTACYVLVNISSYKIDLKKIIAFNNIYIMLTILFAVLSLLSLCLNISYQSGDLAYGYHWGVFYGVFSNPNSGAMICMFSIPLITINKQCYIYKKIDIKKSIRMTYLVGIVIIGIYLFLADSRGALLCLLGFIFSFSLLYSYKFLKEKKKIIIYLVTISITICLGILIVKSPLTQAKKFLINQGWMVTENLNDDSDVNLKTPQSSEANETPKTPQNSETNETPQKPQSPSAKKDEEIDSSQKPDIEISRKENNISSSRFTLWQGAIESIKQKPFFGVGQANVLDSVKSLSNDQSIDIITAGGVHNGYLDLLVSSGCIGFVLFILGIFIVFIRKMEFLIKIDEKKAMIPITLISIIIGIFINNLIETSMIMAIFITTEMLWLHIGILNNIEVALEEEL